MQHVSVWPDKQAAQQKKIVLAAIVIIGAMILFPPKTVTMTNPIMGMSQSQSAGYHFLFDDPAAEQKSAARVLMGNDVDSFIKSGIEWGKLLFQIALVGGGAMYLLRAKKTQMA